MKKNWTNIFNQDYTEAVLNRRTDYSKVRLVDLVIPENTKLIYKKDTDHGTTPTK